MKKGGFITSFFFKWVLLLFFCLYVNYSPAQILYRGSVIDSQTAKPLAGVSIEVKMSGQIKKRVFSDFNGKFEIFVDKSEEIYLDLNLLGYENLSTQLFTNKTEYIFKLDPKTIELSEIVVQNINVNKLLDNALANTRKRLLKHEYVPYSLSIKELNTKTQVESILDLIYTAFLEKERDKNVPYILNIVDVKNKQTLISEFHPPCEFHPTRILSSDQVSKNSKISLVDVSDSIIVLRNNLGNSSRIFYISRNDTTLSLVNTEVYVEKNSDHIQKFRINGIKSELRKRHGFSEFRRYKNHIIINRSSLFFDVFYKQGEREYEKYIQIDTEFLMNNDKYSIGKKLNGYTSQLFELNSH